MKDHPFISIIIPVRNEEKLLAKCLEGLKQLNYSQEKIEVIISDGMSSDNTVEIAKNYGAIVVANEKKTVAPGRNNGFKVSKGELVAFSDADCVMDKNWLQNSLKYFEDEKVAGVGGPNISPENETSFGKAVSFLFSLASLASGSLHAVELKKMKEAKSLPGCNSIYKSKYLEKVMPTDENLLTCDDTEMNYKLRDKGYKLLYAPDVVVYHYRRDNPKKFFKQIYRYAIGRLQLARKRKDAINLVHIIFGLALPIIFFLVIYASYLTAGIFFILIFLFLFGLIKTKSLFVAFNFTLATLIFLPAWSLGFLKELFFPIKAATRK